MGVLLYLVVIIIIFVIGSLVYYFQERQVILRKLKKTKAKPIQRIGNGEYAKVIGKALYVNEMVNAPISNRNCILFQTQVKQKTGKSSWTTLFRETSATDFFLESEGETAIVDLSNAQEDKKVYLKKDKKASSGVFKDPDQRLKAYLEKKGETSTYFILGLNKTLKYYEGIIENGELITVMGVAQWKQATQPIEGYNYSKILSLSGTKEQPLIITDLESAKKEKK